MSDGPIKGVTKYEQIERMIRDMISGGQLKPGDKLEAETQIAQKLGVHRFTVNKALAALVREGLLHRVQGRGTFVVDPNTRARKNCFGVLYSSEAKGLEADAFYGRILAALRETSEYDITLIGHHSRTSGMPGPPLDTLNFERFDGLVLLEVFNEEYIEQILTTAPTPVVVVDYEPKKAKFDHTVLDNYGGGRKATEHLLSLGHRRIAHVGEPPPPQKKDVDPAWQERRRGWQEALHAAGVKDTESLFYPLAGRSSDGAEEIVRKCLALPADKRPTAFFTAGDDISIRMTRRLVEAGLKVPQDISFIGFGDTAGSDVFRPSISTVRFDSGEMGRWAAKRLLELQNGAAREPQRHVVPVELVLRESCGKCKS